MGSKTKARAAAPPVVKKPEYPALAYLRHSRWLYVLVSILLLAPCYWQPRVQAGDLSSHIYNAWLAQLIEGGRIQGLQIVGQTTNILFDWMLEGSFRLLGPAAAQRICVSLSVLIFIWGAFVFARVVSGRKPWQILPCIAMLAYGWVFHMGFFNFYLSLGLCFWALALLWKPDARRLAAAVPLLALAYLAHALPVVWALGLAGYAFLARHLSGRMRAYLVAGSLAAMVLLNAVLQRALAVRWSASQLTLTTGVDQTWVFDTKYFVVGVALLLIWSRIFLQLTHGTSGRIVVSGVAFQLCVLSAGVVFLIPTRIQFPGFRHDLVYIAERMSLGVGVCLCGLLAGAEPRRFERGALIAIALVFFGFLYRDEGRLNAFENQLQATVAQLPPDQRVISAVEAPDLRVNALTHMIDRACIGHCYSYANYEPSTWQFRIRADKPNRYVANTYQDSWLMQNGLYAVKDSDLPLYEIGLDAGGIRLVIRSLPAGATTSSTDWNVL